MPSGRPKADQVYGAVPPIVVVQSGVVYGRRRSRRQGRRGDAVGDGAAVGRGGPGAVRGRTAEDGLDAVVPGAGGLAVISVEVLGRAEL